MRESKLMIRLDEAERKRLEAAAKVDTLSIATWARMMLLRTVGSATPKAAQVKSPHSLSLLSLFCGPGGLDEGFKQAGFETRLAFDIDGDCVNTFNANHANGHPVAYTEDIQQLGLQRLDQLASTTFRPVGVIGGPPCQSFSVSNVHQSDDDPRHSLPLAYARLLSELNTRSPLSFFVFENVPGLLGDKHRHRYKQFKRAFAAAGFELFESVLNAKDYGVPQERERVIIVGINRVTHPHAVWEWPRPEVHRRTVRDTIEGLPDPVMNAPGLDPQTFAVHPNHWCMVPRSNKFGKKGALEPGTAWGRSFRTLAWDEPSWTVAYGNREVHIHPNGRRRLSMYEALLLQSFPKHYVLTGNISAQTRLVSEAVPPRLAWNLACAIRRSLGI